MHRYFLAICRSSELQRDKQIIIIYLSPGLSQIWKDGERGCYWGKFKCQSVPYLRTLVTYMKGRIRQAHYQHTCKDQKVSRNSYSKDATMHFSSCCDFLLSAYDHQSVILNSLCPLESPGELLILSLSGPPTSPRNPNLIVLE